MKRFFIFRSDSLHEWCLCHGLKKSSMEGSGLFAICIFSLFLCCPSVFPSLLTLHLFLPSLFHSFTLSFSVLLSHWDGPYVLWRPSEMKPHIGAVAGGRRRLQKKLCWRSQPGHQPETKLDVVKLSNYLRKLQQNLRRRKTERERRVF